MNIVRSYNGVGVVLFGMSQKDVREKLKHEYKSFKRTPFAEFPCDYFESQGMFVYYKSPGVVEAIEYTDPAQLVFDGVSLLEVAFAKIKDKLSIEDPDLEVEEDGLTSYKFGLGVYAPEASEDPSLPVESVIVFEKGYYD